MALEEVKSNYTKEVSSAVKQYKTDMDSQELLHSQIMEATDWKHRMVVAAFSAKPFQLKRTKGGSSIQNSTGAMSPGWRAMSPNTSVNNSFILSHGSPKNSKEKRMYRFNSSEENLAG